MSAFALHDPHLDDCEEAETYRSIFGVATISPRDCSGVEPSSDFDLDLFVCWVLPDPLAVEPYVQVFGGRNHTGGDCGGAP